MAKSHIEKALLTAANAFLVAQGFDGKISAENIKFTPETDSEDASLFFVPNAPGVVTLGSGGRDRETGFLQIDLNIPLGTGTAEMRDWTDAAYVEFTAGKTYSESGQVVRILSCGENQGGNVDNWFRKSLTVAFRPDLTRTAI